MHNNKAVGIEKSYNVHNHHESTHAKEEREKKVGHKRVGIAIGILAAAAVIGVGSNKEAINKSIYNAYGYNPINKNISGPEVPGVETTQIGMPDVVNEIDLNNLDPISYDNEGNPDKYITDNGNVITKYEIADNESLSIDKDGSVRTSAMIGENGLRTTIVNATEDITLKNIDTYYKIKVGGNSFYMFDAEQLGKDLPNVDTSVGGEIKYDYINTNEVSIKKAE